MFWDWGKVLSWSIQAGVTQYHSLGGFPTTEIYFSVLEAGIPWSGCPHSQVLGRAADS